MAYFRCMGNGSDGASGLTFEKLCEATFVGNDTEEHPVLDNLDTGSDYSNYLSYDSSTGKFTVLADVDILIVPYVYQYQTPSGSRAEGEFYYNLDPESTSTWEQYLTYNVPYRAYGSTAGYPVVKNAKTGDYFLVYTPSSNGYPQQMLKVYKLDGSAEDIELLKTIFEFTAPSNS